MKTYNTSIEYIQEQESTNISYAKVGSSSKKLIVSFSHNGHAGFARKTSLMKLKYKRNDFDVLYIRNRRGWYLGELKGIGENINHTVAFLKDEFTKYDKVYCVGGSAGGYASLLFGSLLSVDRVLALNAQTDLEYISSNHAHGPVLLKNNLDPDVWRKYNKISTVLDDEVEYLVAYCGDKQIKAKTPAQLKEQNITDISQDLLLHGDHNFDNIKNHPSVQRLSYPVSSYTLNDRLLK